MISKEQVETLVRHENRLNSPVLSVYLSIDQSQPSNRNREFESNLKTLFRRIESELADDEAKLAEFGADAKRVLSIFPDYKPRGQGLVVFCDQSSDFYWQRELYVPIVDCAFWEKAILVRPLLEALDEYERFGVILSDRGRARIFTVHLGEIEEHHGLVAAADVRHVKATSADHLRSQMQWQRKSHEHAMSHAKRVAESMSQLHDSQAFDRLVLAGPVEARTEVQECLPKRLQRKVVGSIAMPLDATPEQVLEAARQIEFEVERHEEQQLVDQLLTAAAKKRRAVTSLPQTLQALQDGRVWQLVYANSFEPQGGECPQCGWLTNSPNGACGACGATVEPSQHLMNRVLERVTNSGGVVEAVRGDAAERLADKAGSIGAFLRF